MKKLAKKFLAALLTAVIAVSGMAVSAVTAGAKGIADSAVELDPMELVSKSFEEGGENEYYKMVLPSSGDITIRIAKAVGIDWRCLDSNGTEVGKGAINLFGDGGTDYSANVKSLNKGTYYLYVVSTDSYQGKIFFNDLSYSFTPAKKATISLSTTIKKGDTLQLGSVTENYDGKVTWLSTKKSVATVSSKGLVTAKKAGTTYIRAQMDNGDYVEIKVVVKKK